MNLGNLGDHKDFWSWKGSCIKCGNRQKGLSGLFGANFAFARGKRPLVSKSGVPCVTLAICGTISMNVSSKMNQVSNGASLEMKDAIEEPEKETN